MTTTNTLITRIEAVTLAGELYKNSNLLKNRKDEIERSFSPVYTAMNTKFNNVINYYSDLERICKLAINFESIKNNIIMLKAKITNDDYDKAFAGSISRELDKIEVELRRVWKSYVSEKTASVVGILETLDKLIFGMPEKEILDRKKNIFNSSPIGSQIALQAIEEYIVTYNELIDKLSFNPSALNFLKLLTSGNAVTLNDMDDNVYHWIKTSGFAKKINLTIVANK